MGRAWSSPGLQLLHTLVDGMALLAFMKCTLQWSASVVHAELEVLYESMHRPDPDGL
jgi:hypothetical protein